MFGRRSQRDFEEEIRSHLDLEIERLTASGMSRADAERAARRTFGNVGVAEDRFSHAQPLASSSVCSSASASPSCARATSRRCSST